jgi:transcriptional regulator
MYIPKHFEENDLYEIASLIKEFGFATLVSTADGLPRATHIPLELVIDKDGAWKLYGHIARANPQWRDFTDHPDVLAIFMGPHSYISPSWYDHQNVPTWNYKAVHLSGKASIIEGEALESMLRAMMHQYESAHAERPLSYDEVPGDLLNMDLRALVGIEIAVDKIEAASKLSQNRNEASYESVIENLKKLDEYDSKRIAEEMEKWRPITPKPPKGGLNTSENFIAGSVSQNDNPDSVNDSMYYGSSPAIFENAKKLRENLTKEEAKLWDHLKEKQLGVKFRIQHPISKFIADFYCHKLKLVIEIDRGIHNTKDNKEYDKNRDEEMKRFGLKIIRITNDDIIENIEQVLLTIKSEIP